MNKLLLFFLVIFTTATLQSAAQDSFTVRAQRYIAQYYTLAIKEQQRCGVPASITLAQGVLETEAGMSELACMANNHFGIKCKSDYGGEKFFHDDDRPKECFKMYRCVEESYKDHSDYLIRNKRYNSLFDYKQTDYHSWAVGLKRCGYATNPQYAQRLIKLIEDFKLQEYTNMALDSNSTKLSNLAFESGKDLLDSAKAIAPAKNPPVVYAATVLTAHAGALPDTTKKKDSVVARVDTPVKVAAAAPVVKIDTPRPAIEVAKKIDSTPAVAAKATPQQLSPEVEASKILIVNGLKAFYAKKGEVLLEYALKYNIRYGHLLEINDLQDAPLPTDLVIYLERKLNAGLRPKHIVREGETMLTIAQDEGVVLKRLMDLNMLEPGDEPAVGTNVELQAGAIHKPSLRPTPNPDLHTAPNQSYIKPTPKDDYLPVVHEAPADTAKSKIDMKHDAAITTVHVPVDTTRKPEVVTTAAPLSVPVVVKDTVVKKVVAIAPQPADPEKPTVPKYLQKTDTGKHGMTVAYDNAATTTTPAISGPTTPVSTLPTQQPTPATTTTVKPTVATTTPAKQEPQPTVAVTPTPTPASTKPDTATTDTVDELDVLKSKLDKVVYADGKNAPAPVNGELKEPIKLSSSLYGPLPDKKTGSPKPKKEAPEPRAQPKMYTVRKGDNLSNIAKRNGTTIKKLEQLNDIDLDHLHLGQKIRLR